MINIITAGALFPLSRVVANYIDPNGSNAERLPLKRFLTITVPDNILPIALIGAAILTENFTNFSYAINTPLQFTATLVAASLVATIVLDKVRQFISGRIYSQDRDEDHFRYKIANWIGPRDFLAFIIEFDSI